MLDHDSIVPLYEQIAQEIKNEIFFGRFEAKKRLPTEEELSQQYQVSRITIRRAVSELVEQGLVEKKQGKGTYVSAPKMHKQFQREVMSFTEFCKANGKKARSKILQKGIVVPEDAQVIESLGLKKGEAAVQIHRLRYAGETPCLVEESYFPLAYSDLLDQDLEHNSLYHYLREEKGIDIVMGERTLRIVRADSKTAALLETARNAPLLRIVGSAFCGDGSILHTCQQVGYGEDFDFIIG